MKSKKLWFVIAAVVCVGCCAAPVVTLLVGISGAGLLLWLNSPVAEVLLCLLPLVMLIGGYFLYSHQVIKQGCCDSPSKACKQTQCSSKGDYSN